MVAPSGVLTPQGIAVQFSGDPEFIAPFLAWREKIAESLFLVHRHCEEYRPIRAVGNCSIIL